VIGGFSLGGNVTLKLLAELDEQDPLRSSMHSAIAVAPPIDLHFCSRSMERGVNRIYTKFFLDNLKTQRRRRAEKWPSWAARPENPLPRSIREFDNRHTAPIAGYRDVNDYYNQASTASRLASLAIPTEILADTHDPIVPFTIFRSLQSTTKVQLTVTRHGGHLGYFYRQSGEYRCWMDDWFQAKLTHIQQSFLAGHAKS
jgi:predicted alpha/beta-fold hydrolase